MNERLLTVAYLIDDLRLGGAEKQLSMLASALPSSFKPVVVCLSQHAHPIRELLESAGVEVVTVERRSHLEARRLREALRAVREADADVVHGFLDAANGYAFVCARALRKPVILSVQSDSLRVSGVKRMVLSWMLRRAERVLVNSRKGADFLRNRVGVAEARILHVPNWIDTEKAAARRVARRTPTPPTVGFVGRFAPEKRVGLLLDVFHLLLREIPDARLVLMGDGPERDEILRRVGRLNLADRVELVAPNPAVEGTLHRFDVFVMTSALEGLPNAAIEALAAGIPVVSTRVGDMADIVVEGRTGALFENEDPGSMAATLARVLADRTLAENAAAAGPKLVEERFSLRRAVERLTETYRALAR